MNSSNNILLMDPGFDPKSSPTCNLLLKVGADSLSYAIVDHETKQVYVVFDEQECEDPTQKLMGRLKTDSYLTLPYHEVKVALHTAGTIAVPSHFYTEDSLAVHAKFLPQAANSTLHSKAIEPFGFTTIFAWPEATDQVLTAQLNNLKKLPNHAGLLALAQQSNGPALFLDFSVGSVNVLYVTNEQVVFQQVYEIENSEELNYYLLFMINQLNIDPKATTVHLAGIIHQDDEKFNCLAKYFTAIQFINMDDYSGQELLEDMPYHYYSSLLALNLCAS